MMGASKGGYRGKPEARMVYLIEATHPNGDTVKAYTFRADVPKMVQRLRSEGFRIDGGSNRQGRLSSFPLNSNVRKILGKPMYKRASETMAVRVDVEGVGRLVRIKHYLVGGGVDPRPAYLTRVDDPATVIVIVEDETRRTIGSYLTQSVDVQIKPDHPFTLLVKGESSNPHPIYTLANLIDIRGT
jgi:hypothetical protein